MQPFKQRFVPASASLGLVALVAAGFVLPRDAVAEMQGPSNAPPMMMHHNGMAAQGQAQISPADGRELLHFPPPMQANFLKNMRDHVETLNAALQALAASDYDAASKVVAERLGLNSPSAAGCKPKDANAPPPPADSMDAMMALYMPEAMRGIGLAMHTAASEFAVAAKTHDSKKALEALSRITPNCVACHTAYRVQ